MERLHDSFTYNSNHIIREEIEMKNEKTLNIKLSIMMRSVLFLPKVFTIYVSLTYSWDVHYQRSESETSDNCDFFS